MNKQEQIDKILDDMRDELFRSPTWEDVEDKARRELIALLDEPEPTHDPFAPEVGDWCEFSDDPGFISSVESRLTEIGTQDSPSYKTANYIWYKRCRKVPGITALKHDGSNECPECMRDGGAVLYTGSGKEFVLRNKEECMETVVYWGKVDRYIPRAYLPAWWGGGDE